MIRHIALLAALAAAAPSAASSLVDTPGWRDHVIRASNGRGGWVTHPAKFRFLHSPGALHCMPFGIVQMDNGEILLLASAETPGKFVPVVAYSRDRGQTWTPFIPIPNTANGRPMMLTDLGGGRLCFQIAINAGGSGERYFSSDYGRTWTERVPVPPAADGGMWCVEGNALVDRDAAGRATRLAEIGYSSKDGARWPDAFTGRIRWSGDAGKTWAADTAPPAWRFPAIQGAKSYPRGVSEGSIVRTARGDLVAALRTDMPPRYYARGKAGVDYDDSLEGLAISVSHDDGRTWSPLQHLFEAGRHHADLRRLPDNRIVMTYIVRADVREGVLAGYDRGCEAIVSADGGRTWDARRRIVLDSFSWYDGEKWFNGETGHLASTVLRDGSVLTAYGKYLSRGVNLILWKP